mmetsp:Transcript_32691/g.43451  ORF Transcript_32691/g.43451 Transcript_32691/m.43451 type:complete len:148 (+) Transcript_32691:816-1259(+)
MVASEERDMAFSKCNLVSKFILQLNVYICPDFFCSYITTNSCSYLVKSMQSEPADQTDSCKSLTLPENAVCMCDDDNDLEMALACSHAYLPSVTSSSMAHTVRENEGKLTVTEDISKGLLETIATDEALRIILARVKEEYGTVTDES